MKTVVEHAVQECTSSHGHVGCCRGNTCLWLSMQVSAVYNETWNSSLHGMALLNRCCRNTQSIWKLYLHQQHFKSTKWWQVRQAPSLRCTGCKTGWPLYTFSEAPVPQPIASATFFANTIQHDKQINTNHNTRVPHLCTATSMLHHLSHLPSDVHTTGGSSLD